MRWQCNLARRFKKDSAYAAEYKAFMDNVLAKGYAERVPQEQLCRNDGHVWHIPHHGVYHKRKNKLRVVFDCSSSYRGQSLNAELLQGPDLASSLLGILLRFCQGRIAIMADIEAMYYQVQVREDHRDFLRFLWWPGGDTTKPLEAYRMNVHLFGAVSSPSIANFALKQTAYDNTDKYSMEVLDIIKHGFYVDDCLKDQWRHVSSKENPADTASHGLHIEPFLSSTKWLRGPDFLSKEEAEWPKGPEDLGHIRSSDPEVKGNTITVNCLNTSNGATCKLLEYYSSWKKLQRAVAWWLKCKKLLLLRCQKTKVIVTRSKSKERQQGLTVEDLDEAEKAILLHEQQRYFEPELTLLKKGTPVKADSSLRKLDPILNDEGILRIGGRISNAAIPVSLKNLIILPRDSHVSKLILRDIHQQVGHSGRNHMLARLNQKFWLPSANSSARKIIKPCVFCRRMQA
ncbi:hypothetical protein AAFF_G00426530 [Aldrovandia affinis]|uniref:Integrase zinc-binding domain-containing protein n=1 Tax=Aldrovandia affinis TaxID=143900 RepID=A0AAD7WIT4_9TELE|nr:hypothetical protein AAFF_G00426530 [Aldrovandia affinis]